MGAADDNSHNYTHFVLRQKHDTIPSAKKAYKIVLVLHIHMGILTVLVL